ncbi:MAG: VWA domain-containing protein [Saprospiraceae bacterium]|nr:VWA domain-containing protein [Saprospiraceae bacterium]
MTQSISKTIHNLIILDESGSMETIKKETISGFNELMQTIQASQQEFPAQQHFITLVTFNGLGIRSLIVRQPVASLQPLDDTRYRPQSMTPLYDALGFSCTELEQAIRDQPDSWCLVTVLTDGMENASREYAGTAIRDLVDRLGQGNWTFTYIGANHDVARMASDLSIANHMQWESDLKGSKEMWARERHSRMSFSMRMDSGSSAEDLKKQYFETDKKPGDADPD